MCYITLVEIDLFFKDGWSIVHLAVMGGSVEIVEFLIFEFKANPTTKCNVSQTVPFACLLQRSILIFVLIHFFVGKRN